MGKSSDPPPAPDYEGIAEEQAEASKDLATQQTYANRPYQITPWGETEWSTRQQTDPTTGKPYTAWMQEMRLDPTAQRALDAQLGMMASRSATGRMKMGQLRRDLRDPLNWEQFGESEGLRYDPEKLRRRATNAAYKYATSRLDPRFDQDQQDLEIRLRNQGLRPGDAAYTRAMGDFNRAKTDAYEQATRSSFLTGQSEAAQLFGQQERAADYANARRQADIADALRERGMNLNEVNALISGQQVATPQMPNFRGASVGQTPQYMNAAQLGYQGDLNAYNAEQMAGQGFMSGLGNAAALVGGMFG